MTLAKQIMDAFKDTPHPGSRFEDISITLRDEGSVDYFAGKSWQNHNVKDLHYHYVALSFFTPKAFRYYLPAFLLADLSSENKGLLSDFIAHAFTLRDKVTLQTYLAEFSKAELEVTRQFFKYWQYECLQANDAWSFDTFAISEQLITAYLETFS